jgi:hypothetical protein
MLETVELLPPKRLNLVTCLAKHSFTEGDCPTVIRYLSRKFLVDIATLDSRDLERLTSSCIRVRRVRRFYRAAALFLGKFLG